jgi:transcriptional regulator with XRE-family HTH domain
VAAKRDTQPANKAEAGERLKQAMAAKGWTELKPYARHLAGDGAEENRVESLRRQLRDWLNGKVRMSDPIAEWLARDLDQPEYAFRTPSTRRRRADELEELRGQLAAARGEIASLTDRVQELESEQDLRRADGGHG